MLNYILLGYICKVGYLSPITTTKHDTKNINGRPRTKKEKYKSQGNVHFSDLGHFFCFSLFLFHQKKVAPIVFEQFFNGIYLCQF
jgi:hypothetical protein